jgi:excinuclease ABC subunit A
MDENNIYIKRLEIACHYYKIDMNKKINDLKRKELDIILYGSPDIIDFRFKSRSGNIFSYKEPYEGVITNLQRRYIETNSDYVRDWISQYMVENTC